MRTFRHFCCHTSFTHHFFSYLGVTHIDITLELLHGSDIDGLDVVLKLGDLVAQLIERNLLVLNNQVDLQLLDTEADRNQLGGTPDQTILLNTADGSLEANHVGLIIYKRDAKSASVLQAAQSICRERKEEGKEHTPGLDVHGDDRLGSNLGLGLLLLAVLGQALLTDAGGLGVLLLVVAAEEVDVVVLLRGRGLGGVQGDLGNIRAVDGVGLAGIAGEGRELLFVRGDVLVPAGRVGVLGGVGGGVQGLEGNGISLRGRVTVGGKTKVSSGAPLRLSCNIRHEAAAGRWVVQRCTQCWVCNHLQVLRLLSNTDHGDHQERQRGLGRMSQENRNGVRIPGDVGAGEEPVVEHYALLAKVVANIGSENTYQQGRRR